MSESREFSLAQVLSLKTGTLVCALPAMHELAEYMTGGPIWTHEFGQKPLWEMFEREIVRQHPSLAEEKADGVTKDNWQAWLADMLTRHPATLTIAPIPDYSRTKGPMETLVEMAGDKPIIAVTMP